MVAFFAPAPHYVVPTTMIDVINHLGSDASLVWVVDAGDANSFAGASEQSLLALPAGAPVWTRGPDTSVDTIRDPQFSGVIGGQSLNEYWDVGRGHGVAATSYRRLNTTKAAWSNGMHQNNAAFTLAGWFRKPSTMDGGVFMATMDINTDVGINYGITFSGDPPAGRLFFWVANGGGSYALESYSTITVPTNQLVFIAVAVNESGGTILYQVNASQESIAASYASPSASASTYDPELTLSTVDLVSGRLYNAAFWSRVLSSVELLAIYNASKTKFGL